MEMRGKCAQVVSLPSTMWVPRTELRPSDLSLPAAWTLDSAFAESESEYSGCFFFFFFFFLGEKVMGRGGGRGGGRWKRCG